MKPSVLRLGALICVVSASVLVSRAAQVVLVLHTGANSWQVLEAEKIAINSKSKVRIGSAGSPELQPAEYKNLPAEEILRVGIMRKHAAGYMIRKDGGNWAMIAPEVPAFKAATSYAALWSSAAVTIQEDRGAKTMTPVRIADVFAILPGADGSEAVVSFLSDASNFRGAGEEGDNASFDERMSLLVSAAGLVTGSSAAKLQDLILTEMTTSDQRISSGIAHYSDLERGLLYVEVSKKAWPNDDRQQKAREALVKKKQWLDQRIAILRAFNAGELWDAFLDKYGDFGRFDNSFETLRKMREKALAESRNQHFNEGKRLFEAQTYDLALVELNLALHRSPKDEEVQKIIDAVSARKEHDSKKQPPLDIADPNQKQILRHLAAAKNYIKLEDRKGKEKKWDDAEREIRQAEALDAKSYSILHVRALLLEAQGKLLEALKMLDQYAKVAPDKEATPGEELRGTIASELSTQRETHKDAVKKSEAEGRYEEALDNAQAGVALDPSDLYFLLHAALNNAIMRHPDLAKKQFDEYVQLSQTSSGDQQELGTVYKYLSALKTVPAEPEGNPNWYSGYRSPPGLFYCPISLMPNAHINDIKASRKQDVSFQWNNGELASVVTRNKEGGDSQTTIYFKYSDDHRMVQRVSTEPITDKDTKAARVVLLNYPEFDPLMVERLMGKRVALIVAGNEYFHPFVWKGVYTFLAEYDEQGRVKSATPTGGSVHGGGVLTFQWNGLQLKEIAEQGGTGYRRTMNYSGSRLDSEVISGSGKNAKITYTYTGDKLVGAICDDDRSMEGRSRRVTFQ